MIFFERARKKKSKRIKSHFLHSICCCKSISSLLLLLLLLLSLLLLLLLLSLFRGNQKQNLTTFFSGQLCCYYRLCDSMRRFSVGLYFDYCIYSRLSWEILDKIRPIFFLSNLFAGHKERQIRFPFKFVSFRSFKTDLKCLKNYNFGKILAIFFQPDL